MVKLGLLFIVSLMFVVGGGYLKNNPDKAKDWGEKIQHLTANRTTKNEMKSGANYQAKGQVPFTLETPPGWNLDESIPGCGPVWFAPESKEVWLTICEEAKISQEDLEKGLSKAGKIADKTEARLEAGEAVKYKTTVSGGTLWTYWVTVPSQVKSGDWHLMIQMTDLKGQNTEAVIDEVVKGLRFE